MRYRGVKIGIVKADDLDANFLFRNPVHNILLMF